MKIVAYEDDGGRTAVGIKLEDGVLPSRHSDLTALIKAGPGSWTCCAKPVRARASWCIRRSSARHSGLAPP